MEPKVFGYKPSVQNEGMAGSPDQTVTPTAPQTANPLVFGYKAPTQVEDVSTLQDIGKSLQSGALMGAAALRGLPGSVMYYGDKAGDFLLGRTEPDQRDLEDAGNLSREQREAVRAGEAVPFYLRKPKPPTGRMAQEGDPYDLNAAFTLPTVTGSIKEMQRASEAARYDPQTMLGDLSKTGADFMVQGGPMGAPRKIIGRSVAAFGSGATSEAVGDISSIGGPYAEAAGRILGAVGGDLATRKFSTILSNVAMADTKAAATLAELAAKDLSDNPELASKLQAALDRGENIIPYDFLGPNAKSYLNKHFTPDQVAFISQFNSNLTKRAGAVDNELNDFFSKTFGGNLRDENFASSVKAVNDAERTQLYTGMRNLPHAQSVWTPELRGVLDNNGLVAEAANMVSGMAKAKELPAKWNIQPLDVTPPIKGVPQQFIVNPNVPPNIQYWDQVQRKLRALADAADRSTDPSMVGKAEAYREARTELLNAIEAQNAVPEFSAVRNRAAELFGAENSLEGGFKMAQKLGGQNPFKVDEFMSNFDSLTPAQKFQFVQGAARFVFGKANKGVSGAVSYLENPEVSDVLKRVMGPDKFEAMYGKVVAGAIKQDATMLETAAQSSGKRFTSQDAFQYLLAVGGSGAAGAAPAILTNPSTAALLGGAAATIGLTGKLALSASEARIAERVLTLAMSKDPADAKKLGQLISQNYDAASVLMKQSDLLRSTTQGLYNSTLNMAARDAEDNMQNAPIPIEPLSVPLQNRGGRVERKSGGRIGNAISTEVDRTRALLSNKTASMLSMPDDAIVTALNHAKNT